MRLLVLRARIAARVPLIGVGGVCPGEDFGQELSVRELDQTETQPVLNVKDATDTKATHARRARASLLGAVDVSCDGFAEGVLGNDGRRRTHTIPQGLAKRVCGSGRDFKSGGA